MDVNEKVDMVNTIKKELKDLHGIVRPIAKHFNKNDSFPEHIMVLTLIQNACFGTVNNLNVDEELNKIEGIYNMIEKLSKYLQNDHVINFLCKEFNAILICSDEPYMEKEY